MPFTVYKVHNSQGYTVKDAVGNQKRLHQDQLHLFRKKATQSQMAAIFPETNTSPIKLDANFGNFIDPEVIAKPGKLIKPEIVAKPTSSPDEGVATVQMVFSNKSQDGSTEPLVEASWATSPYVKFTHI